MIRRFQICCGLDKHHSLHSLTSNHSPIFFTKLPEWIWHMYFVRLSNFIYCSKFTAKLSFPNVCYISRFVVVNNINIFKSNQDSPCLSIFSRSSSWPLSTWLELVQCCSLHFLRKSRLFYIWCLTYIIQKHCIHQQLHQYSIGLFRFNSNRKTIF